MRARCRVILRRILGLRGRCRGRYQEVGLRRDHDTIVGLVHPRLLVEEFEHETMKIMKMIEEEEVKGEEGEERVTLTLPRHTRELVVVVHRHPVRDHLDELYQRILDVVVVVVVVVDVNQVRRLEVHQVQREEGEDILQHLDHIHPRDLHRQREEAAEQREVIMRPSGDMTPRDLHPAQDRDLDLPFDPDRAIETWMMTEEEEMTEEGTTGK